MAVMPELTVQIESRDSLEGDVILIKHQVHIRDDVKAAIQDYMEVVKANRPGWENKLVLIMDANLDLEIVPLESLRQMRDRLNELIFDHERKRKP